VKSLPAAALQADRGWLCFDTLRSACRAAVLVFALAACGSEPAKGKRVSGPLPSGVVARVASSDISQRSVEQIALAQRLTPRKALEKAVPDALFALEAQLRLPRATRAASERAALARALLETLAADAEAKGPASDAEIQRVTAERWVDLDRPVSVRTSHAVVLLPKTGDPSRARSLAERIQQAVHGIRDPEAFLRAARAVPTDGLSIRAERLPYVTPDGRAISTDRQRVPAGEFDEVFSRAANALQAPGDQSPVIQTRFGYHVILLEERLPERRMPEAERRAALGPEVLSRRADTLRRELVVALKQKTRVEVQRDAEEQTAQLNE
jgi:peptidyl-prolyl cis-trans isomerase C